MLTLVVPGWRDLQLANLVLDVNGTLTLDGELLLVSGYGCVERLAPGMLVTVAAHERISVENNTERPASMLVCLAPPTFAETLLAESVPAARGASC